MLFRLLGGELSFGEVIQAAISCLLVIFLAQPVHEWAHAFVADKLGDRTAKYMGRLTLNPFAHIDYLGALGIIVFGLGWAKPVPVNMLNFKKPKRDMAFTALAGPVSNLLVSLIFLILGYALIFIFKLSSWPTVIASILYEAAWINVCLAVFNFIPIPPLDGSRLLNAALPDRIYYRLMQYERYFSLVLMLLVFSRVLNRPLNFLVNFVFSGINYVALLPFKLILG